MPPKWVFRLFFIFDEYRLFMEEILASEWLVLAAMFINMLLAPSTKVEENFNIQATYDIIYNNYNLTEYDHNTFPGVVPRTFAGPLFLSIIAAPTRLFLYFTAYPRFWMLFVTRFILGMCNVFAFLNFARCIRKHFGYEAAMFLRMIACSQFHFFFYASRTLPNTFAMIFVLVVYQRILDNRLESAVRWATTATVLFRCELVLLFAPFFIPHLLNGRLPILGFDGAIFIGLKAAAKALLVTVPIDSLLWGRLVWPEGEVAWFNIFLNKSSDYGVSPFFWYFYSALPRALLSTIFLVPLGLLVDRRLKWMLPHVIIFIFLYSFLPHKELRFIMYSIPIFNVCAAVYVGRMYINRKKSWIRRLVYYGCCLHIIANLLATSAFLYAAARNYPAYDGITHLQWTQRIDANKNHAIYIDNACAQTGVNRFLHLFDAWEYNKTETLTPQDMERFEFLMIGTYGKDLKEIVTTNYTIWHRIMFVVPGFHGFSIKRIKKFPYIYPEMVIAEKVAVLRKKY